MGVQDQSKCLIELNKTSTTRYWQIYLWVKNPFEPKYQLLINGREKVAIKNILNPKAFIDYSRTFDDVYENLENYNPTKCVSWYGIRYVFIEVKWRIRLKSVLLLFKQTKKIFYLDEDSGNVAFDSNEMGILNIDLNHINLDNNFDEDYSGTIIYVRLLA